MTIDTGTQTEAATEGKYLDCETRKLCASDLIQYSSHHRARDIKKIYASRRARIRVCSTFIFPIRRINSRTSRLSTHSKLYDYNILFIYRYILVVEVETICDDAILLTADQTFWASFSESPAVFSAAEHANKATERRPKKNST